MTGDRRTSADRGRRQLNDADRHADAGERPDEYATGAWHADGDPLASARAEAVEQSAVHREDQQPPTRDVRKAASRPQP
jgi:hypothetical protein